MEEFYGWGFFFLACQEISEKSLGHGLYQQAILQCFIPPNTEKSQCSVVSTC
jgi:hypothetical protein